MYDELLDRWDLPRPRTVTATAWGWNNETFVVSSAAGGHVLRISANAGRAEVEFEHELLLRLAATSLPFATPLPVSSVGGGTIETFHTSRGARPATLFRQIPGRHPVDEDIDAVAAGAEAFGHLDRVLATMECSKPSRPMSSDLATVSRSVPTLAGIEDDVGKEAAQLIRAAARDAANLPSTPRQLIHGDFALGNVLFEGTNVVGILDFEFSGPDRRAMELATALGLVLTKTTGDRLWRPVVAAYLRAFPLNADELRALPTLTRLGRAVGLLWWVGREREGRSSKTNTAERVQRLRDVEMWISRNADDLVDAAVRSS